MKHESPPPEIVLELSTQTRFVKKFIATLALAVCLIVLALFWYFHFRASSLLKEQLLEESRAYFQQIVLTRQWISDHGGIYVKADPEEKANPYLKDIPGLNAEIFDTAGVRYILKNPALVTKEISFLGRDGALNFTSLA